MNTDIRNLRTSFRPKPQAQVRHLATSDLQYHLLSPRTGSGPLLKRAYELWRNGWAETLREVAGLEHINSDEFVRQDEIGVLVSKGKLVCVTGLRRLDLSLSMAQEDSYFRRWPPGAVEALGPVVVGISSNTYIPRMFRKAVIHLEQADPQNPSSQPMPLTACIIGLTGLRFHHSNAQKFLAVPRNDRGMNRLLKFLGGRCVGQISVHGIASDLIVKDRSEGSDYGQVIAQIWDGHKPHY